MKVNNVFVFGRRNYTLILVALAIIIIGFVCMSGSSNDGAAEFNKDIFSFRRITLAPILVIAGYTTIIIAIFLKPKR